MIKDQPLGVLIFAILNSVVFGAISFIFSISAYFSSALSEKIIESFKKYDSAFSNLPSTIFGLMFLAQAIIALIFLISGIGIFLKKEWARKLTVYFSFFLLVIIFLSTLANPGLIKQGIVNALYPAVLIFYFTSNKVARHFAG